MTDQWACPDPSCPEYARPKVLGPGHRVRWTCRVCRTVLAATVDPMGWQTMPPTQTMPTAMPRKHLGIGEPFEATLWVTLECGCENETDRDHGVTILHYVPTCWRHAVTPVYVIQEHP